jgi:hypothetical protein
MATRECNHIWIVSRWEEKFSYGETDGFFAVEVMCQKCLKKKDLEK